MNKKLIIGIIAAILAVVAIVVAIVAVTSGIKPKNQTDNGSDTDITSSNISATDSNPSSSDETSVSSDISGDKTVVSNYTVSSDGTAVVETEKPTADTIIDLPITISDNAGFTAGNFVFSYDTSALTYLDYAKGDLFDEYEVVSSSGKINCLISSEDFKDIKGSGKLIVLKFKVNDGTKAGKYTVKADTYQAGSTAEQLVSIKVNDGIITVK